jgi:hypothetical protein
LNIHPTKCFKSVENIEGQVVITFDDLGIYKPVSIVMNNKDIYVQNNDEDIICVVNCSTLEKTTLLKRGEGPGEALNITYISTADDAVITAECNKRCIIEIPFHLKKTMFSFLPSDHGSYTSIIRGPEGFITSGCFREGRYMHYNPSNEKTSFFGEYRVQNKYKELDNFTKSLIYISSKIAIKPDMTRFVAINFNNGVIDINGINKDSIINLKKLDFHYQDIVVKGSMEDPHVSTRRSNKNGFFDVATSDEYIYTIYSGKSFDEAGLTFDHCEYLMVFDWNGNPVACYKPNVPLYAICYNKQDNAVYGIHIGDEAKLYKFDI